MNSNEASVTPDLISEAKMQNSGSSIAQSEAIQEWLQNGMGYRPQGGSNSIPFIDLLRKICNFLLQQVKSEKIVKNIKRNILVSGNRMGRVKMGE
ncbi:hypothetical protein Scep_004588 [Stephania cephalantha]|uniref:Uncharacterized protein n=1 Tax=Stephania cephalantha TaxID=152367 RepID=A0AAP0KUD3_9MAGN